MRSLLRLQRGAWGPTLRYVRRRGMTVRAGPFAGLRYPPSALAEILGVVPRLAGTFEVELHEAVERLIARDPALIVNIGAADGYYAIGMARRCPEARVIAYEADPARRRTFRRVARRNAADVDLYGTCTPDDLAGLGPPAGAVVFCDVDGPERVLIDPERVPWLNDAALIIEVHELIEPGVTELITERLTPSHDLEWIDPKRRYLGDPENKALWGVLSPVQQQMLLSEVRPMPTRWLIADPRSASKL